MSVEIIGMITAAPGSEVDQPTGAAVDPTFITRMAQAHETAGFDRALIGYFSNGPEGSLVSSHVAAATQRLGILLAYRPGVIAAPLAARQLATLDQFSRGRVALNVVSGGNDADLRRDGDFLDHDARYTRTDEYLDALKRIWTADAPVDFDGEHYRFEQASPAVQTWQKPHIPIYFSGASDAAIDVAARHADTYMLWGEPLDAVEALVNRVRTAAKRYGRKPRFSISFRPIVADTEAQAWARADDVLRQVKATRASLGLRAEAPENVGSQRLLAAAQRGDVVDERLWMGVAKATGARWNSTALVGTAEQVAQSLGRYYALGVDTFLIRGFDPLGDTIRYGESLIPAIRRHTAELDRQRTPQAA
ncbi:alkanesulfonate monooxygenase [Pandoraea aquatica]|uniref:Alkanesulfonate monooxygenase n=1 Tax=Pandoraea aquatica TaxID=2508290 RepID=A0A5E4RS77_9BURK|nr:LLM class flavin-dependent oxidoreductase [Pandoraea aquatica]VVD66266.1 alkanesulfonate monooxygenase [Pandoraea aquatica]